MLYVIGRVFQDSAFVLVFLTWRTREDSHGDEGVEATEAGAHGLDADGGREHNLMWDDHTFLEVTKEFSLSNFSIVW